MQAEVAALGEVQREELRLRLKSLDEIEGGFGTALVESFPDFLCTPIKPALPLDWLQTSD